MPKRATIQLSSPTRNRVRATVMAAGFGTAAVLGAGAAVAADSGAHTAALGVPTSSVQSSVQKQAGAQAKAADHAKQTAAKTSASWIDPVKHYSLSAGFGLGGNMWSHKHSGQDFAVPTGTKVMAAHSGTVVKTGGNGAGDGPAYGNAVVIKHSNGKFSQYAHLSKIDVKVGQHVNTGQDIAKSGSTGNSSGPHLHFEVRTTANYGSAINPVTFLKTVGVKV
ncbi:M23 family metallopeptidase [Streptomyces tsukubensis]|uniref:Peptidase n=1 Tax=Streptomyces tsukubensis TaxID=83656 RepID=A0A1V3ZZP9_9ACTN|nr:M23 family metallopeptidase [Streptomyces tsukubensis]OON71658.1 peptidase [Streptomyces tsukubensis]QFR95070.1 peptidoglycan DD-metalloendopeptidase family protein [Streptomyces tsukubensis]